MEDLVTAEELIFATFPGDDPLHASVRLALLRVVHAFQSVESELPFTAQFLSNVLDDPPWFIWYGPTAVSDLAAHLRSLAGELEKSAAALNAAQPSWEQFNAQTEPTDVATRQPDAAATNEAPF